jgi:beta-glucosidase
MKALALVLLHIIPLVHCVTTHFTLQEVSSVHLRSTALPSKVLIGYASSNNHNNVIQSVVEDGVNVVIWAFVEFAPAQYYSTDESPLLTHHRQLQSTTTYLSANNLNLTAIRQTISHLNDRDFNIVHLASIGGWNGRHLPSSMTADQFMEQWHISGLASVFHGIDWDFEGNDDLGSEENVFTVDCLEKMGEISRLMKRGEL